MDDPADLMALIRSGDWLDAQTFPPLRWAVHGLIPQGFGLFTGPPKAGKSWAALGIALAVSSGGQAFGKVPVGDPRPVLYLALEDGDARLQWRARQLLGEGEAIPRLLHTVTRATPDIVVPLIRTWMGRHPNETPLVLLDTLGKVMPASRPGESAYQRDYRIGSVIKELADDRPGSTVMVIHHTRKATGEDWMDSTSGTNGLNGAADFTLNLSRTRNEDAGVLRVTGRDVSESEYAITSREGRWTLDGTSLADAAKLAQQARATEGLGDRSAEVIRILARSPQGMGPTEVARELGDMTASNAGTYLDRLVKSGRIAKKGRGLYAPVETVECVETGEPDSEVSTHSTVSTPLLRRAHSQVPSRSSLAPAAARPAGSTSPPRGTGPPAWPQHDNPRMRPNVPGRPAPVSGLRRTPAPRRDRTSVLQAGCDMTTTTALERLNQRIADLAQAGTFPPCARRPEWTSEDSDEQESARLRCEPCPAHALCADAVAELRPTAGTWAGITYGTATRRKAAS